MTDKRSAHYIDAHVHVWTDNLRRYPLGPGFTAEEMKPTAYSPTELLHDSRRNYVDRVVLVQMIYYGFDNSYMLDAIKQHPRTFKGIAVIDSKSKAPDVEMHRLAEVGVRGFRLYPNEVSSSNLKTVGLSKMFDCAARERLAMCLLINPDALAALTHQCSNFPDTPVVIDHLARIGFDGSVKEPDIRALCALAKFPQVYVKLSGFYALGQGSPPHSDLLPLIERVYDAYGPKRLMWGSDSPFLLGRETYTDAISLIRDRLDFATQEDRDWMLSGTAEQLFFRQKR